MPLLKIRDSFGNFIEVPALKGNDGKNFTILGVYPTLLALQTAHPTGTVGDYWAVGDETTSDLYIWDSVTSSWKDVGQIGLNLNADMVLIDDLGSFYIATEVEGALQEVGANLSVLNNIPLITKEPTGFTNNENIDVSYNSTTRKVTLTGSFEAYFKGQKVTSLVNGWESPAHADVTGNYYLYYNGSSFVFDTTSWTFDMLMIAFIQYNSHKIGVREVHGLMAWQTHKEFHDTIGAYKCEGGDFSNYTLNSTVATNRRPQISATSVCDEDLKTNLSSISSNYTQRYLTGANQRTFNINQTDIISNNGSIPYWNQFTGGNWVQTLMGNNDYGAIFVVAAPMTSDATSQLYRYMFVQPQQVSTDLAVIQALSPSNLVHGDSANLLSEFVFIGKIIVKASATNWVIWSIEKLEGTKINQVAVGGNFLTSVLTDSTLSGNGTTGNPLTVPNKVSYTVYTATIPSASWTGASAPYSKAVTVTGILSTDEPIIDLVFTGTYATDVTMRTNWAKIYRGVTSTDTVTFYADSVPTADINIQLVVVR